MTLTELGEKIPEYRRKELAKALVQENENQENYDDLVWIASNGIPNEQVIKEFEMGVSDG